MRRGYWFTPGFFALFLLTSGCDQPSGPAPVAKNSGTTTHGLKKVSAIAAHTDLSDETKKVPAPGAPAAPKAGGKWVTIEGQVLLPEATIKTMGEKKPIVVSQDKAHCLSKGPLYPDDVIVNPKNRGLQNAVIWLRPANKERAPKLPPEDIFPDYAAGKVKPKDLVIDQPCCQFVPRITLAREGDTLTIKNSAPVNHNTKWSSNNNGEFNVNLAPGQSFKLPKPLVYERTQIPFECNIHPWMKGQVRVFDHPYFALTDADGKFEIKNAPAGKFNIVYAHENGFHKGADGRFGWPIEIKDDGTGKMVLKPLEYEFPK
ncbi:MAG TPA: hypothetical protein VGJ05_22175 [Fimbriiglobus sp.]|jgi:hypothetical protein